LRSGPASTGSIPHVADGGGRDLLRPGVVPGVECLERPARVGGIGHSRRADVVEHFRDLRARGRPRHALAGRAGAAHGEAAVVRRERVGGVEHDLASQVEAGDDRLRHPERQRETSCAMRSGTSGGSSSESTHGAVDVTMPSAQVAKGPTLPDPAPHTSTARWRRAP
jgi:hypothetical protein